MWNTDNWDKIKLRFDAWWEQELVDRVLLQVTAPKDAFYEGQSSFVNYFGIRNSYTVIREWRDRGFDHEYLLDHAERNLQATFFGGESFPHFWVNLGPGSLAAYLGAGTTFTDETVWFGPPTLESLRSRPQVSLDRDSSYWTATESLIERACERGKGNYLTTFPDLGGALDVCASLRGSETLLMDMLEDLEGVKSLRDEVIAAWIEAYETLAPTMMQHQGGTLGWIPTWNSGRSYPLQSDISAMISPQLFAEVVVPEIEAIGRRMDRVIYHLDGPDAVKHLDLLLEIPEVDAIQWVPGDGAPPAVEWVPMLRKIQTAGRSLYVYATSPVEVETLISQLAPEGLLICTSCDTEQEAKDLVELTERLSRQRIRT